MREKEKQAVVPQKKASPPAGSPVEHVALSQMGRTFAERAAARKKSEKSVQGGDTEDKSVSSPARKK